MPPLDSYAWRLWDYWERHLDPDLFIDRSLRGQVEGKVVLVTGGSSGIGKATACKLAEAGAHVVTIARDKEQLDEAVREFEAAGLKLHRLCRRPGRHGFSTGGHPVRCWTSSTAASIS